MPKKSPFTIASAAAKKARALRKEVKELRRVGQQLSNVAYNMGQEGSHKEIRPEDKAIFNRLRREWDAIERTPE